MTSLTLRSRVAVAAGKGASWASRRLGRGSGGMIGGKVALKLDPNLLAELAKNRRSVVVSGTNGKSTTTRLLRAALFSIGHVASNTNGDNMTPGITTALMRSDAPLAALEVDEMHMPTVSRFVDPQAMVLLNLSRDQLDRVGEIGAVERRLRKAVNEHPNAVVIANCDDPLVASAAWDSPNVQWVAAGHAWMGDSTAFPRGGRVIHADDSWRVVPLTASSSDEGLDQYRRPDPLPTPVPLRVVGMVCEFLCGFHCRGAPICPMRSRPWPRPSRWVWTRRPRAAQCPRSLRSQVAIRPMKSMADWRDSCWQRIPPDGRKPCT